MKINRVLGGFEIIDERGYIVASTYSQELANKICALPLLIDALQDAEPRIARLVNDGTKDEGVQRSREETLALMNAALAKLEGR